MFKWLCASHRYNGCSVRISTTTLPLKPNVKLLGEYLNDSTEDKHQDEPDLAKMNPNQLKVIF